MDRLETGKEEEEDIGQMSAEPGPDFGTPMLSRSSTHRAPSPTTAHAMPHCNLFEKKDSMSSYQLQLALIVTITNNIASFQITFKCQFF